MLRHILFDVEFFADEDDRANSQKRVLCLLEALVWCNRLYLQNHPDTPLIYQSGIKYIVPEQFEKAQLPEIGVLRDFLKKNNASDDTIAAFKTLSDMCGGGEHFREIPRIIENGGGDCDNVAAWRCAELRELGVDAKPYITWRRRDDGGMTYHVIVRWPDGSSEDPSLLLGMGGAGRAPDKAHEEEKLGERVGNIMTALAQSGDTELVGQFLNATRAAKARTSMRKALQPPVILGARTKQRSSVLGANLTKEQKWEAEMRRAFRMVKGK